MEKSRQKNIIRAIVIAISAFLVLLAVALIINLVKLSAVNKRKAALAAQSAQLDTVINVNDGAISYCRSPEFIEDYAREYLDMIYRDEIVIEVK